MEDEGQGEGISGYVQRIISRGELKDQSKGSLANQDKL